jgi:hypothetical protein
MRWTTPTWIVLLPLALLLLSCGCRDSNMEENQKRGNPILNKGKRGPGLVGNILR